MKAMLETTVWDGAQLNHLYWMDSDRVLAYCKWGKGEPEYFAKPMTLDLRGRVFKEVKKHPFAEPKQKARIIKVAGSKGAVYEVNCDDMTCTCTGFKFRGTCKHLEKACN